MRARAHGQELCALLQFPAFALAEPAPDAKSFVILQRVFEALGSHLAGRADALCIARRPALFGKKCLGVCLRTQRIRLPRKLSFIFARVRTSYSWHAKLYGIDKPILGNA